MGLSLYAEITLGLIGLCILLLIWLELRAAGRRWDRLATPLLQGLAGASAPRSLAAPQAARRSHVESDQPRAANTNAELEVSRAETENEPSPPQIAFVGDGRVIMNADQLDDRELAGHAMFRGIVLSPSGAHLVMKCVEEAGAEAAARFAVTLPKRGREPL